MCLCTFYTLSENTFFLLCFNTYGNNLTRIPVSDLPLHIFNIIDNPQSNLHLQKL